MDIKITITKADHDLILSQLRKNKDGSDDLTVQQWLQEATDGKVHQCRGRAHMATFE